MAASEERIHHLFNELHKALTDDMDHNLDLRLLSIRTAVDAAHHDFTNATLLEQQGLPE